MKMAKTAEERGHFRGQFRTVSGFKVRASFDKGADGSWKIFSVGGESVPTQFLPYSCYVVPGLTFDTLDEAKAAVQRA